MKPLSASLLLVCLLGCAHPPRAQPLAGIPVVALPDAKATTASRPPLEFPRLGLRVRCPGPARVFENDYDSSGRAMHTTSVTCRGDGQEYFVARYSFNGSDRLPDDQVLANAKQNLASTVRETRLTSGEFLGIELEGTNSKGEAALLREYVMGDGVWLAAVTAPHGKLSVAPARAFLDSIALSVPWTMHSFPAVSCSVLLPENGIRLGPKELKGEDFELAEASVVGGVEQRVFAILVLPIEPSEHTADERLDAGERNLVATGHRIVWKSPIEVDGFPGRELLAERQGSWSRLRIVTTERQAYILQASARSKDALVDDTIARFLKSLRCYGK